MAWLTRLGFIALLAVLGLQVSAKAQGYPERNLTIVVCLGPGTGMDVLVRVYSEKLAAALGNLKGQSGFAAGIGYALTDSWRFNAAFTASPQQRDYGFVVGGSVTLN